VRRPQVADEMDCIRATSELAADGHSFLGARWQPGGDWATFLDVLDAEEHATALEGSRVPQTVRVAEICGRVAGVVSVRHRLNDALAVRGGHIGYSVRPRYRRRGVATALLRAGLDIAADHGVERALVTCDDTNIASATVIERCGGQLEGRRRVDGVLIRRYMIDVQR
jgi:predicted acetyltransferase